MNIIEEVIDDYGYSWHLVNQLTHVPVSQLREIYRGNVPCPSFPLLETTHRTLISRGVDNPDGWLYSPLEGEDFVPIFVLIHGLDNEFRELVTGDISQETLEFLRKEFYSDFETFIAYDGHFSIRRKS